MKLPVVLLGSAALLTLSAVPHAAAQTGTAPFCLQTPSGGARCVFGSMGECESARGSTSGAQCITSSDARGTTGLGERPSGGSSPPPKPPPLSLPPG